MSFVRACEHIRNFTAGHETQAKNIEADKFSYPDNHIEADNRLSWFLGQMDKEYGDKAYYVVLKREKANVVASFNKRWKNQGSIIKAFGRGILMQKLRNLTEPELLQLCDLFYDTVYDNIDLFTKDKSHVLPIRIENIKQDFRKFWHWIGAEGDIDLALAEFDKVHNKSKNRPWIF